MKLTAPLRQEDAKLAIQLIGRWLQNDPPSFVKDMVNAHSVIDALEAAIAGKKPAEPTPAERLAELERRGQRVLPETTAVPTEDPWAKYLEANGVFASGEVSMIFPVADEQSPVTEEQMNFISRKEADDRR